MSDGKAKAKCNYYSLGLQPQADGMEVHIAQVFCVILLLVCEISADGVTQSCIDAPNETKSKAENLVSNRLERKRGSRAGDESKDGISAESLSARTSQQKRQRARGTLDAHFETRSLDPRGC